MEVKVSVIVPVYQAAAYLDRCVTSLLEQTLPDLEIILVDDGSTDGSAALCDVFARQDSRIRVIHQENRGPGRARNAGLDIASGAYVGFTDADDYVLPEMYQRLYMAAAANDADLVLSGVRHVNGIMFEQAGGEEIKHNFEKLTIFEGPAALEELTLGVVGALPREPEDSRYGYSIWKNLYRGALLNEGAIRFPDRPLTALEDLMFLIDLIPRCGRAVGIPGAYYCYCRNEGSISKSFYGQRMNQLMELMGEVEQQLAKYLPESRYRLQIDREIQAGGRLACIQEAAHGKAAGISGGEVRRRLRQICRNETLSAALRRYPWWKLPWMQAAFAFTLRFRLVRLQQLLIALRSRR